MQKIRVVIKVGSAVLTEQNRIARERMLALVELIASIKQKYEVILVSSGAVAAGYTELKLDKKIIANKQALASIGQPLLMHRYKRKFEAHGIITAQVLLSKANFNTDEQITQAKNAIDVLLAHDVLPIINENDATAIEELVLGDNDQLSAYAAHHFDAELLVILSDINAYYDKDPNRHDDAKVLRHVKAIEASELEREVTPTNSFATGGIVTKLKAAQYLLDHDKDMFLSSGFNLTQVTKFLLEDRYDTGTLFTKKSV